MTANKIADKIRKLLAQAKDREGTPEGDAFERKAFDLLARYGLTEFDVEDRETDMNADQVEWYFVEGSYVRERQLLLSCIGHVLGCAAVRQRGSGNMLLAGTRRNVERTKMLFETLVLHAASGASKVRQNESYTTQQMRHSYWIGYSERIAARLDKIEKGVRDEIRKTGSALVPMDEYAKAHRLLKQNARVSSKGRSRSRFSPEGHNSGVNRANQADLGQSRIRGQRELA